MNVTILDHRLNVNVIHHQGERHCDTSGERHYDTSSGERHSDTSSGERQCNTSGESHCNTSSGERHSNTSSGERHNDIHTKGKGDGRLNTRSRARLKPGESLTITRIHTSSKWRSLCVVLVRVVSFHLQLTHKMSYMTQEEAGSCLSHQRVTASDAIELLINDRILPTVLGCLLFSFTLLFSHTVFMLFPFFSDNNLICLLYLIVISGIFI